MKRAATALLAALALSGSALVACDPEDRQDVREGVKDVEQGVDKLDDDGKDD